MLDAHLLGATHQNAVLQAAGNAGCNEGSKEQWACVFLMGALLTRMILVHWPSFATHKFTSENHYEFQDSNSKVLNQAQGPTLGMEPCATAQLVCP